MALVIGFGMRSQSRLVVVDRLGLARANCLLAQAACFEVTGRRLFVFELGWRLLFFAGSEWELLACDFLSFVLTSLTHLATVLTK